MQNLQGGGIKLINFFRRKKQNRFISIDEHCLNLEIVKGLIIFLVGCVAGMLILATVKSCDKTDYRPKNCQECHANVQHKKFSEYFRKAGSKQPEEMANAVLKTEKPKLLAAIAVVESGGNPSVRNSGYKQRHHGAFQVNPKYWGKVPKDASGQAKQAENILRELTKDEPLKVALSQYGGDTSKRQKYANLILEELQNVPK